MHGLPSTRRVGGVTRGLLLVVTTVLLLATAAWYFAREFSWSFAATGPILHPVQRGEFVHEITGRGVVESMDNVDIKCEAMGLGAGTTVLWVIPEGTYVEPAPDWKPDPDNPDEDPPDLLVKLDYSSLQNKLRLQQIDCNTKKANVIPAKRDLEMARNVLMEYTEGNYKIQMQGLVSWVSDARESFRKARQTLEYEEALLAQGHVTATTVEADRFAVEKARKDTEVALTAVRVLEDYTYPKFIKSRESDIAISIVRVKAEETNYQIALDKLALIEDQIAKCVIRAPAAGQVVYANEQKRGEQSIVIEAGAIVREHQVLLRLPNFDRLQINAKINEAAISMVAEGMPATIRLDAFEDTELRGIVRKVNEYPESSSWYESAEKVYETTIEIDKLPTNASGESIVLRPGMTAEVSICVETDPDVVHVPVQAVFEHEGEHYCAQPDGPGVKLCRVTLGPTNDETVVLVEGPKSGEQVVMDAASYRSELEPTVLPVRDSDRPVLHTVERGEFVRHITERGSVESAENVDIKCQVEWGSAMILWVIPEGTHVKPAPDWEPDPDDPEADPPDLLVKFGSSALDDLETQHHIWCATMEAVVVRNENELEIAKITLTEYIEGTYEQQKQTIESRVFVERENFSRSKQRLEYNEDLQARGYVTAFMPQRDRFAVKTARRALESANTDLRILADYTKRKTELALRTAIDTKTVQVRSERNKYELTARRLVRIQEQIANCTVRAPAAGQVVYFHEENGQGQPVIIEEGLVVRHKQTILRLPNPAKMQIEAKINVAAAAMVDEGMPATIHLDAFRDVELTGSVQMTADYPMPAKMGSNVREYKATVAIDDSPTDASGESLPLRPGMTAEVRVRVQALPNVIHVPLEAVYEQEEEYYCVQLDGEGIRLRPVRLGSSNTETVVILEGLAEGDQIVAVAADYRDQIDQQK